MKILVYSDVHWSQNSSIVRSNGLKYSTRLENLIESINWVERLAWSQDCDCIICCGDFFDTSTLNAQEISALQEIRWAPLSHLFLIGNHETNVSSLEYSTTDLFKLCPNVVVLNTPQKYFIDKTDVEFCFLPYILERDRKPLVEYFGAPSCKRVIFSHNDLKDVQYGSFMSTEGFELSDIENNCNLFLNGHIHHCCNVTSSIINIGNLTGQNFTEDASKYSHCAIILDTDTLEYKFHENPYSFKFRKIDLTYCDTIEEIKLVLDNLDYNSVITVTVSQKLLLEARALLEELKQSKIQEYRLLVQRDIISDNSLNNFTKHTTDHLKQFEDYVLSEIGSSDLIKYELARIMR